MGYSTSYTLEARPWPPGLSEQIEQDQDYLSYALEPDGSCRDSCKWYDHEADVRELSRQYPGVLFTLNGEGEEAGDLWRKYFRDGRMQVAQATIIYADFDERLLC